MGTHTLKLNLFAELKEEKSSEYPPMLGGKVLQVCCLVCFKWTLVISLKWILKNQLDKNTIKKNNKHRQNLKTPRTIQFTNCILCIPTVIKVNESITRGPPCNPNTTNLTA